MEQPPTIQSANAMMVKLVIDAWAIQNKKVNDLINKLGVEKLSNEVAPGRNTGTYLIGHLTAVNDGMLPLLGLGTKLYPELEQPFLRNPDKSGLTFPTAEQLIEYWHNVNEKLNQHFAEMQPEQWLERHTAVSEEAFAQEPHRNKLAVLINRTNHQSYHLGQMNFIS